ncbi:hypothetical protein VOLCADRAFT_107125 [Volvox carteri f. nagariensis]|uniref:Uncharacterized protein n=1 Tax=Volvox carteri f. nagariensis TaxID=3068 RepID=D8UC28_VOLCA|nr:uncharacterized protein VOLCADRAFT_107125 [Volvox carteri f. nagariensis]EFJ42773.1 hypothetical protein VOLCADRAFT_107125 [Volvox carteri f. nagariensis]|eukprot:XP_002956234.1 hypothetical protein VOLCADRAFT_107125 [Volvox carteri f. nagariensis]
MVSRKEAAAAFTAAAKALDVRGKELGDLCFALSKLSVEELEVFPIDGDNEAIVEFMRSVKASAAGLGMGSAAGAGGTGPPRTGPGGIGASGSASQVESMSISKVSARHLQRISSALGMKQFEAVSEPPLSAQPVLGTESFNWTTCSESNTAQRAAAITWMKDNIPAPPKHEWIDCVGQQHMLDCRLVGTDLLALKGSCDLALCTSAAVQAFVPHLGLRIVVELKKEVKASNVNQLAAELIAANSVSPNLKPVAVMTDLVPKCQWQRGNRGNNMQLHSTLCTSRRPAAAPPPPPGRREQLRFLAAFYVLSLAGCMATSRPARAMVDTWIIAWIEHETIMIHRCHSRATAVGILRAFLDKEHLTQDSAHIAQQPEQVAAAESEAAVEVGRLLKRQRLPTGVAAGRGNDVANLEDLLDFTDDLGEADMYQIKVHTLQQMLRERYAPVAPAVPPAGDVAAPLNMMYMKFVLMDADGFTLPRRYKYFELSEVDPRDVEGRLEGSKKREDEAKHEKVEWLREEVDSGEATCALAFAVRTRSERGCGGCGDGGDGDDVDGGSYRPAELYLEEPVTSSDSVR